MNYFRLIAFIVLANVTLPTHGATALTIAQNTESYGQKAWRFTKYALVFVASTAIARQLVLLRSPDNYLPNPILFTNEHILNAVAGTDGSARQIAYSAAVTARAGLEGRDLQLPSSEQSLAIAQTSASIINTNIDTWKTRYARQAQADHARTVGVMAGAAATLVYSYADPKKIPAALRMLRAQKDRILPGQQHIKR